MNLLNKKKAKSHLALFGALWLTASSLGFPVWAKDAGETSVTSISKQPDVESSYAQSVKEAQMWFSDFEDSLVDGTIANEASGQTQLSVARPENSPIYAQRIAHLNQAVAARNGVETIADLHSLAQLSAKRAVSIHSSSTGESVAISAQLEAPVRASALNGAIAGEDTSYRGTLNMSIDFQNLLGLDGNQMGSLRQLLNEVSPGSAAHPASWPITGFGNQEATICLGLKLHSQDNPALVPSSTMTFASDRPYSVRYDTSNSLIKRVDVRLNGTKASVYVTFKDSGASWQDLLDLFEQKRNKQDTLALALPYQGFLVGGAPVSAASVTLESVNGLSLLHDGQSQTDYRAQISGQVPGLAAWAGADGSIGYYYNRLPSIGDSVQLGMQIHIDSINSGNLLYAQGTVPESTSGKTLYRLYNPNSGEHFYTDALEEKYFLYSVGWHYEFDAWKAPDHSEHPVYRLYNPNSGDHHYTLDAQEKEALTALGWKDEGTGWYSADPANGQPLFRLYNPNAKTGNHHYTRDSAEREALVGMGWKDEGIGWYGLN